MTFSNHYIGNKVTCDLIYNYFYYTGKEVYY